MILKRYSKAIFIITLSISVILLVVGFLLPPAGVIDGSVISAVGELLGFATIAQLPLIFQKGSDIRLKHGNTIIEIDNPDETITKKIEKR